MKMSRYASNQETSVLHGVPLARVWTTAEWAQVCQFRAMLDVLLTELSPVTVAPEVVHGIRDLGPKLRCYAVADGCFLYLETQQGGLIEAVPDDPEERVEFAAMLSRGFGKLIRPDSLPANHGLFEWINGVWENCWMFRNRKPSALVANRRLLQSFPRWAICEAHERAHGIGLDEKEAVMVEIAVAELLVEKEQEGATELLAESNTRLLERSS